MSVSSAAGMGASVTKGAGRGKCARPVERNRPAPGRAKCGFSSPQRPVNPSRRDGFVIGPGPEPGKTALLWVLVRPLLQGPEGLRAAAKEDAAEEVEVVAEVSKPGHRIVGEPRVRAPSAAIASSARTPRTSSFPCDSDSSPKWYRHQARSEERTCSSSLRSPRRNSPLSRSGVTAAVATFVRLDELEASGPEHLGRLRHALLEL